MLPPPVDHCDVCYDEYRAWGAPLYRCTRCKNQFYCSTYCQRKEWPKHKYNCSLLPPGPLPPASITPSSELDAEVDRAKSLLRDTLKSWEPLWEAFGPHDQFSRLDQEQLKTPEYELLKRLELSPTFAYTPTYPLSPIHHALASISRLFLLHRIASLSQSPDTLAKLSKFFDGCIGPSEGAQLWGPKVVARPGDLSSGEYLQPAPADAVHDGRRELRGRRARVDRLG